MAPVAVRDVILPAQIVAEAGVILIVGKPLITMLIVLVPLQPLASVPVTV